MSYVKSLGLMSGTSMDGVDVALLETDGKSIKSLGPTLFHPYDAQVRQTLKRALKDAKLITSQAQRDKRPGVLALAEFQIMQAYITAIQTFISQHGIDLGDIACIGMHGQTVLHRPEKALTLQLGIGDKLVESFSRPVIYDFREKDMLAGGQGAPLAPVYHKALVAFSNVPSPVCVVNLGGVANVTWIGASGGIGADRGGGTDEDLLAFDTGPANALLDDWVYQKTGETMDKDGAYARAGHVHQGILTNMLKAPYFEETPPKSLDRLDFNLDDVSMLSLEDGAATLCAFTAQSLAKSLKHMPAPPKLWILCGGGAHNAYLYQNIKNVLEVASGGSVKRAEDLGWRASFIEAEAFAYMAVRSMKELPISFPGTTGVKEPLSGGILVSAG